MKITEQYFPVVLFLMLYKVVLTRERGTLPSNRLIGMCRWMASHFHDWIDYNGVAFSIELPEWGRIFSGFGDKNTQASKEFGY